MTDFGYGRDPYPRTRLLQEEVARLEGEGAMDVMVLRLPYIFGLVAGQRPLWQFVIDTVRHQQPKVALLGGTTSSVTARQVGQAAVGAMEHGRHGASYPINSYDLSYAELEPAGLSSDRARRVRCRRDPARGGPSRLRRPGRGMPLQGRRARGPGGAHGRLPEPRCRDPTECAVLGIEEDDVVAAIVESFRWRVDHPVPAT